MAPSQPSSSSWPSSGAANTLVDGQVLRHGQTLIPRSSAILYIDETGWKVVDHAAKLFVFVLHPDVEATNNRSERQARSEAMARKAARTSKSQAGANRRSIIMSVLASLSKRLEPFTLSNVLAEIARWFEKGQSVFREGGNEGIS